MVDTDTFLTVLYVMADAFCKCQSRPEVSPGLRASLTGSEVVTLVIFSQWGRFRSERDFYTLCRQPTSVSFPDAPPPEPVQPADPAPLRRTQAAFSRHPVSSTGQALVDLLQGQRCL